MSDTTNYTNYEELTRRAVETGQFMAWVRKEVSWPEGEALPDIVDGRPLAEWRELWTLSLLRKEA